MSCAECNVIREITLVEGMKVTNVCSQNIKHSEQTCRTYGITCVSNLRENLITTLLGSVFQGSRVNVLLCSELGYIVKIWCVLSRSLTQNVPGLRSTERIRFLKLFVFISEARGKCN
jgi:hypothetical protein